VTVSNPFSVTYAATSKSMPTAVPCLIISTLLDSTTSSNGFRLSWAAEQISANFRASFDLRVGLHLFFTL
jgi:hypothetical protein